MARQRSFHFVSHIYTSFPLTAHTSAAGRLQVCCFCIISYMTCGRVYLFRCRIQWLPFALSYKDLGVTRSDAGTFASHPSFFGCPCNQCGCARHGAGTSHCSPQNLMQSLDRCVFWHSLPSLCCWRSQSANVSFHYVCHLIASIHNRFNRYYATAREYAALQVRIWQAISQQPNLLFSVPPSPLTGSRYPRPCSTS